MHKLWLKIISGILNLAIIANLSTPVLAYEFKGRNSLKPAVRQSVQEEKPTAEDDVAGHWAEQAIRQMMSSGIVSGIEKDGEIYINPDGQMTRAQFIAVFVRANGIEAENGTDFTDTEDHWARAEIRKAAAAGIINGYPDGSFRPDNCISRAEATKIIALFYGLECDENSAKFADIPDDFWANKYIAACAENGIVNGYPDGTFRAENVISRAEGFVSVSRGKSSIQTAADKSESTKNTETNKNAEKAQKPNNSSSGGSSGGGSASDDQSYSTAESGLITEPTDVRNDDNGQNDREQLTESSQSSMPEPTHVISYENIDSANEEPRGSNEISPASPKLYAPARKNYKDWYGDGTADKFYISEAGELYEFAQLVNNGVSFDGKTVCLKNDLDIDNREWLPIGRYISASEQYCFYGTFDGEQHTIKNLQITDSSDKVQGLFGYSYGKICNLKISGGRIEKQNAPGFSYVGAIAGYNNGSILNCESDIKISSYHIVGGLVGLNNGTIEQCVNGGNIMGSTSSDYDIMVGGISGYNSGTITGCENSGKIEENDKKYKHAGNCGGIAGFNKGLVGKCKNTGKITGDCSKDYVYTACGGIVGESAATVESCINEGDVYGDCSSRYSRADVGGIVGYGYKGATVINCDNIGNITSITSRAGGICGFVYGNSYGSIEIYNCRNAGSVKASSSVASVKAHSGGIIGKTEEFAATAQNCVNLGKISGTGDIGGICGFEQYVTKGKSYWLDSSCRSGGAEIAVSFNESLILASDVDVQDYHGNLLINALNEYVKNAENVQLYAWTLDNNSLPIFDTSASDMTGEALDQETYMELDLSVRESSFVEDPVDAATGAQAIQLGFLAQNTRTGLAFVISYNSLIKTDGTLGRMWTHNYETKLLRIDEQTMLIKWNSNRQNVLQKTEDGKFEYSDTSGIFTAVQNENGGYDLLTPSNETYKFDSNGRLISQSDRVGNALVFEYDEDLLVKITDKITGRFIKISYENSLIVKISDNSDRFAAITYENGVLTEITDEIGAVRRYLYNEKDQITAGTIDGVQVFRNTFDVHGRIIVQYDGKDVPTVMNYCENTENGIINTTVTERNGQVRNLVHNSDYMLINENNEFGSLSYEYDENHRVTKITDNIGRETKNVYDASGNLILTVDPMGTETEMSYDDKNQLIKVIYPDGTYENYTYDQYGNVTAITDRAGRETINSYDENGNLVKTIYPNGASADFFYNEFGELIEEINTAGVETFYEYDSLGRMKSVQNHTGQGMWYEYDAAGRKISERNANGETSRYEYDTRGNLTKYIDALGGESTYTYDENNNIVTAKSAGGIETSYEYDGMDRLIATTDGHGNTSYIERDAEGKTVRTIDRSGVEESYIYDEVGRLSEVYDAYNEKITSYSYNKNDQVERVQSAGGEYAEYLYDVMGRVTSENISGEETKYAYNSVGLMTKSKDAAGNCAYAEYNELDQITEIRGEAGTGITFEYDEAGRQISQSTVGDNKISYSYDDVGQISTVTNARGETLTVTYDIAGRISEKIKPDGSTIKYEYDKNGRIIKIIGENGNIEYEYDADGRILKYTDENQNILQYSYDNVGNLESITYPDGKLVHYSYDAGGKLASVIDWNGRETRYYYDANGRLSEIYRENGTHLRYEYNTAGQLVLQQDFGKNGGLLYSVRFEYDKAGKIIEEDSTSEALPSIFADETKFEYDSDSVLVSINGEAVVTDADGNVTHLPLFAGALNIEYDYENRITNANETSYAYDLLGNRIRKSENGSTSNYVVNPNSGLSQILVREKDGKTTYYVYGIGLISEETENQAKFYHFDVRGSTVVMTDEDGRITDTFVYDTYGNSIGRTGETDTEFMYCGQYGVQTDDNGLIYMRARYYAPEIQRFLSLDPVLGSVSDTQSLNRYAFCGGNPVTYVDPTGNAFITALLISAGIGAATGIAGEFVSDVVSNIVTGGEAGWSSLDEYIVSGISGAASGVTLLCTGSPFKSAAVGSAISNGADFLSGRKSLLYASGEMVSDTIICGALLPKIPALPVNKITKGRGSFKSVYNQVITKLKKDTVKKMSPKVMGKGVVSGAIEGVYDNVYDTGKKIFQTITSEK